MKEKFIKLLSPITLAVVFIFDIAVIGFGVFAVKKLIDVFTFVVMSSKMSVFFFAAIEVFAIILAVIVTKEVLTQGVRFYDDEFEFTALDDDNIFAYSDIIKVETQKDSAPSFTKNFIDRHSRIILTLKDDKVVTIDIGLTTKNALKEVADEIIRRLGNNDSLPDDEKKIEEAVESGNQNGENDGAEQEEKE